jgi:taurine dioxygenase
MDRRQRREPGLEARMTATGTKQRNSGTGAAAPALIRPSVRRHSINLEVCTPAIGAELSGISLADAALDPDMIAEIRALWLKHKVLFFRDQDISPIEQQAFAARFGDLEGHPIAPSHPEADKLLMLYRNLDPDKPRNYVEKASRENLWHADVTFRKAPPRGAVLRCELGPETGGDTMWSNMAMAFEKLPEAVKARIDGLYAKHDAEHTFGAQLPTAERLAMAEKNPAAEHPVVLTHPETGEKVLFVNSAFTTHFSNYFNFEDIRYGQDFMPEAHHLMTYLTSQAAIPEYQVRLKWRTNTVAMWDNLQVQHYAVADYGKAPRKMLRATIAGAPLA